MKRDTLNTFSLILVFLILASCSTKKNTVISRAYHNLTAHYNVYFNGHEALIAGEKKIEEAYPDDYTKLLPIFKSSDPRTDKIAASEMNIAIEKGAKLIRLHSITVKPVHQGRATASSRRFTNKKEYNNWVDDAYFLIGQAYYYQHDYLAAISNFSRIIREYKDASCRYDAFIWLVRCYNESERFTEARDQLQKLQSDPEFPKRLQGDLAVISADYHIRQGNYDDAIPYLEIATKTAIKHDARVRYHYILAQLCHENGKDDKAVFHYQQVLRKNPPYEMAFYARINSSTIASGNDGTDKLIRDLHKMLRDSKNHDYLDMIYFALGNIYFKKGATDLAINNYRLSSEASINNKEQKAKTCSTLANLYFEKKKYVLSQCYYDSAMIVIDHSDPSYKIISERSSALTRLVSNLKTVEREDSLQRLAGMSQKDRDNLINKWITEQNRKVEAQKKEMGASNTSKNFYLMNQNRLTPTASTTEATVFYFYNPTTIAYGRQEFAQLWGKRKLEDNWRRLNKSTNTDEISSPVAQTSTASKKDQDLSNPTLENLFSRDYYLKNIPLNDSLMSLSNDRLKTSLYQTAHILKIEFSDYKSSSEIYENLLKRFPGCEYELSAYFDLYETYNAMAEPKQSDRCKHFIVNRYPQSKYAMYLQKPDYFVQLQIKNDSITKIYDNAFYLFKQQKYNEVIPLCNQMLTMSPDSLIQSKIAFLKTIAEGRTTNNQLLALNLRTFVNNFPQSEPAPLAESIIKLISLNAFNDYQKLIDTGYLNNDIKNEESTKSKTANDEFRGKFSYEPDLMHYFVIAVPSNTSIDLNKLRFDIANYNLDHFTKIDFDIETENLNNQIKLISVRSLEDKDQALVYFRSIIRKKNVFQSLANTNYVNFVISSSNYRALMNDRNYDEYLRFFIKNYSHFTSNDFPQASSDDSPEALIAKAKKNDLPTEKGSYVMVNGNGKTQSATAAEAKKEVLPVPKSAIVPNGKKNKPQSATSTENNDTEIKQKSATAAETKDNQALNISDTIVGQSKHQTTT
ncbi:MAG: tetratricopeptide repeat protein, partial [Bacteroidota bacterium]|nr:tetratricopeptide repeat protein [Bacteroidota bacterium]